ncbi:MAG: T9SS type A sorting domain-containing protein [Bacteroidota bacterium]
MKILFWLVLVLSSVGLYAQTFEMATLQDAYKSTIGETLRVPVKFKNITDKPIILVIRKIDSQIGGTQKNYFCLDNNCFDQKIEDYSMRIEAGQTVSSLQIALEAGLSQGVSSVKYLAYNKFSPGEAMEFEVHLMVEEKLEKQSIYNSRQIVIHDIYPIPIFDHAFVDYKLLDDKSKAKIVIHNLLGSAIDEYDLPYLETKVKIRAESLSAGIYFYTLYIDNEGVVTRKLIVKK